MGDAADLERLTTALEIARSSGERAEAVQLAARLGDLLRAQMQPTEASVRAALQNARLFSELDDTDGLEQWLSALDETAVARDRDCLTDLADKLHDLAFECIEAGALLCAELLSRHALWMVCARTPSSSQRPKLVALQAQLLHGQGQLEPSVAMLKEEIDRIHNVAASGTDHLASLLFLLIRSYFDSGRAREALPFTLQFVGFYRENPPEDFNVLSLAVLYHVQACAAADRLADAARELLSILTDMNDLTEDAEAKLHALPWFLTQALAQEGNVGAAEALLHETLAQHKAQSAHRADLLIDLMWPLARLYIWSARVDAAEPLWPKLSALMRAAERTDTLEHAAILNEWARALLQRGQPSAAEPLLREALAIRRSISGESSLPFALSMQNLAELYLSVGRLSQAEEAARSSLEIVERVDAVASQEAILVMLTLGRALSQQAKHREAEEILTRCQHLVASQNSAPPMAESAVLAEIGWVFEATGRFEEAVETHRRALTCYSERFGTERSDQYYKLLEAPRDSLERLKRYEELRAILLEVIPHLEQQGVDQGQLCARVVRLGIACVETNRREEGERYLRHALDIAERELGPDSYEYVSCAAYLVQICASTDRWSEAEQLARLALEGARRLSAPNDVTILRLTGHLARCCHALGRDEEAEALFGEVDSQARLVAEADTQQVIDLLEELAADCYRYEQKRSALKLLLGAREMRGKLSDSSDQALRDLDLAIERVRLQIDRPTPEGVQILRETPPGEADLALEVRCLNAFFARDYHLCVRHAIQLNFRSIRTGLLVVLSYMHLEDLERATIVADALKQAVSDNAFAKLLVRSIVGQATLEEVLTAADDEADRCTACLFYANRRIVEGDEDDARRILEAAVAHAGQVNHPYLDGELALRSLEQLRGPSSNGDPTAIETSVRRMLDEVDRGRAEGRSDDALERAREARVQAYQLGVRHPTYGDTLLALVQCYDERAESELVDRLAEEALDVFCQTFPPDHPDVARAISIVLMAAASAPPAPSVHRALCVLERSASDTGLLLLLRALPTLAGSDGYPTLLKRARAVVRGDATRDATLRVSLGQTAVEEALETCVTDEQRCRVYYLGARWQATQGGHESARANFEAATTLDVDCVERSLALDELAALAAWLSKEVAIPSAEEDVERRLTEAERLLDAGQPREAGVLVETAEHAWRTNPAEGKDASLNNLGILYYRAGRFDDALRVLQEAARVCTDKRSKLFGAIAENLGTLLLEKGERTTAGFFLNEARMALRSSGGERSPRYMGVIQKLLQIQLSEGGTGTGWQIAEEYADLTRVHYGAEDPRHAEALVGLSQALRAQQRPVEALPLLERAAEIMTPILGEATPEVFSVQLMLETCRIDAGQTDAGYAGLERCLEGIKAYPGPRSGQMLLSLASTFYTHEAFDRAEAVARLALGLFDGQDRAGDGYCVSATQLADALQAQGRLEEALPLRLRVVDMATQSHGDDSVIRGHHLGNLALTLEALGEAEEAASLFAQSIRLIHGRGTTA